MHITQCVWDRDVPAPVTASEPDHHLVLVFGSVERLTDPSLPERLERLFPGATVVGCTSEGTITAEGVWENTLITTSVAFTHTRVRAHWAPIPRMEDGYRVGRELGERLKGDGLAYVLLLATGVEVNGSTLTRGLDEALGGRVLITGGLANDGNRFEHTYVLCRGERIERGAVAVGFYGDRLKVGHGALGGWKPFGPIRRITRSEGNVVYEFDGKPALPIYEGYLGKAAEGLPATGLLFPLELLNDMKQSIGLVRTLVGIDRERNALIFAGDVPQGCYGRLMQAHFDELVEGAEGAARQAHLRLGSDTPPSLALLISCIGRKMLLGSYVDDEVEAVRRAVGEQAVLAGFYSNGEISPFTPTGRCELHNQTMTVTTFAEA